MRVAIYGGSFHPPHIGHAMVAGWLRWTDLVDEVWLVPAFSHPFDKALAPFPDRVAMCEAMAHVVGPWVRVETIEAELPTPSYTIDTLDTLRIRYPSDSFRLVVGADVLEHVDKWKRWDTIVQEYSPIIVGREGWPAIAGAPTFPSFSSTEVRQRLAEGLSIAHLVPAAVERLIRQMLVEIP